MPVFHEYKCIFVHITKTGGTSIESVFNLPYHDNTENRKFMYGEITSKDLINRRLSSPVLQHLTIMELKKLLEPELFNSYFKFAFVRNPWDRVLSQYFFDRNIYRKENPISFHEFLTNLNEFHKRDQVSNICDENGNIIVDYIGKYESLTIDFKTIAKRIGLKNTTLPILNPTKHYHYSSYYTPYLRDLVADLYKRDIEAFGYTFKKKNILWWRRRNLINIIGEC